MLPFAALPALIKGMGIQKLVEGGSSTEDVFAKLHNRTLSTGPYAKASKRTGITLVAGDTTTMHPNVRAGTASGNIGQDSQLRSIFEPETHPVAPIAPINSGGNVIQHGAQWTDAEKKARLGPARPRQKNAVEPEQPLESEESIRKRLGM